MQSKKRNKPIIVLVDDKEAESAYVEAELKSGHTMF